MKPVSNVSIRVICKQCEGWGHDRGWCGPCRGKGSYLEPIPQEVLDGDRVDLAAYVLGRRLEVMDADHQRSL